MFHRSPRKKASVARLAFSAAIGICVVVTSISFGLGPVQTPQALAQSSPPVPANVPNLALVTGGQVSAVTRIGSIVYFGGSFSDVRLHSGYGAVIQKSSGTLAGVFPKVDGKVYAVAEDGANGWYVGGDFLHVGNVPRKNALHILSNSQVDPAWNPEVTGTVTALLASGSTVYLGGDFTAVGGVARNNLAVVNATNGALSAWNPNSDGGITTLALDGSTLYAGGNFHNIGGAARDYVAAINTSSGAATAWNPNPDAPVHSLALDSSVVFVGGG
ncbi:MAG: hypothetical protein V1895_03665, partial [Parcubacteria group bacterium]